MSQLGPFQVEQNLAPTPRDGAQKRTRGFLFNGSRRSVVHEIHVAHLVVFGGALVEDAAHFRCVVGAIKLGHITPRELDVFRERNETLRKLRRPRELVNR
jgi:hypothetical protein